MKNYVCFFRIQCSASSFTVIAGTKQSIKESHEVLIKETIDYWIDCAIEEVGPETYVKPEILSIVENFPFMIRARGYKLLSCSTQLSTKNQLLIKTKTPTNEEVSCFKSLRCCIYHANKC